MLNTPCNLGDEAATLQPARSVPDLNGLERATGAEHGIRQLRVCRQVRSAAIWTVDRNLTQRCLGARGAQAVPQVLHDYHTGVPGGQATRRCAAWPEPRWGSLTDGNAMEARVGARQQGDFPAQNRSSASIPKEVISPAIQWSGATGIRVIPAVQPPQPPSPAVMNFVITHCGWVLGMNEYFDT
ncbi:MAG: hypothetical protein FRX49_13418 [Trebouxia sp. A1-2]|nr:MAG: hypothetical protein FRX49_13418 [Trebouxia sp. A1-2]